MTERDWPAAAVAVGILLMVGAVLVTATIRWSQPEVVQILEALSPVLGVVTGAFVTYFFTRHAVTTAQKVADDSARRQTQTEELLNEQIQRARTLHNALTTTAAVLDERTGAEWRRMPAIRAALDQI